MCAAAGCRKWHRGASQARRHRISSSPSARLGEPVARYFNSNRFPVDDIKQLDSSRALTDREHGLGNRDVHIEPDAARVPGRGEGDSDARRALSALEVGVLSSDERPLVFTPDLGRRSGAAEKRSRTIGRGTRTTMRPVRSLKVSAAAIRTRRSTGSRKCSRRARMCVFSPDGSSSRPVKMLAMPIRTRSRWPWPPCRPPSLSACPSASCRWPRP